MKQLIASFAGNRVLANLLMAIILLAGVGAACLMIREDFPSMKFDMISASISWDGASPTDIEEGLALKIEDAIDGVEGIKTYGTTSSEGELSTTITVKKGYDPQSVYDRVKNKIDQISTFPDSAKKPVVTTPTILFPVVTLGVSGNLDERGLKELATTIKDELKESANISQVFVAGTRDYQVNVKISEEMLRKYGLTLNGISSTIAASSLNLSGGRIKTRGEEFTLRTAGKRYTARELAHIVVIPGAKGEAITLGQLATITDGFTDEEVSIKADGGPVAMVNVSKTSKEDAILIADAVKGYVAKRNQSLEPGASISILADNTLEIRSSMNILVKNGFMGLVLVFAVLWLFLDTRLAFWAGMGIPISLSG
ncbi:MAG: efflux RND transporter permease subunit, partial [Desulfobacterales bacterium]|nr:efflux RND transporter permease subunit [Desulfobacterales bacterium]